MTTRRGFLRSVLGASAAVAAASLLPEIALPEPRRTYFLPPRGGWFKPETHLRFYDRAGLLLMETAIDFREEHQPFHDRYAMTAGPVTQVIDRSGVAQRVEIERNGVLLFETLVGTPEDPGGFNLNSRVFHSTDVLTISNLRIVSLQGGGGGFRL